MPCRNYADLIAWQQAIDLTEAIYRVTETLPPDERYGLTAQMRRSSVSISANIAEGQGRRTSGEFLNHLSMAHGSVRELETHVIIAARLKLLSPQAFAELSQRLAEVGRLIQCLINALERTR
jgi:four helix bundle protein